MYLSGTVIVSAFADSKNEDIRKRFSSTDLREKFLALESLEQKEAASFSQELITLALFGKNETISTRAKSLLFNIPPSDQGKKSNGQKISVYDNQLSLLDEELSSFIPDKQIRALRSLKNRNSIPPFIEYVLLRVFLLEEAEADIKVQKEFMGLVTAHLSLQRLLVPIATDIAIPKSKRRTAQNRAKDILRGIKSALEIQMDLWRIFISDTSSTISKVNAQSILINTRHHPELQLKLADIITISYADPDLRADAAVILKNVKPDDMLVDRATPSDASDHDKKATDEEKFNTWNLYPEVQLRLAQAIILISDPEKEDEVMKVASDVLLRSDRFYPNSRTRQRSTFRFLTPEVQEDMFLRASVIHTPTITMRISRKYARRILAHTRTLTSEIERSIDGFLTCRRTFTTYLHFLGRF